MGSSGADLSFVNLGITIEHLPNSITLFGFRIAFYGIIIGLGMLAGMALSLIHILWIFLPVNELIPLQLF